MKTLEGIDISKWQGKVDFSKVKMAVDFAILREGYRKAIDQKFIEYVKGCNDNGIQIPGVYHFIYALSVDDAVTEANSCIKNVKKAGLGKDIIIFADFEYDTVTDAKKKGITLGSKECIAFTQAFCETVEKAGYKAGIYTNQDYYKNMYKGQLVDKYVLWLADYEGSASYPCTFHQTSASGSIPGISGNVDTDKWYQAEEASIDELVEAVLAGQYGTGDARKQALGDKYEEVQAEVNKRLKKASEAQKIPVGIATNKDDSIAGTYTVTDNLNLREGAGTDHKIIKCMLAGTKVICYGYYTPIENNKWYYVVAGNDKGFCDCRWLSR